MAHSMANVSSQTSAFTRRPLLASRVTAPAVSQQCGAHMQQSSRRRTNCRALADKRVQVAAVEEAPPQTEEEATQFMSGLESYFDELLEGSAEVSTGDDLKYGDKVRGTVFKVDPNGAWIDVNAKSWAFVDTEELTLANVKRAGRVLQEGMQRDFDVISFDRKGGHYVLSMKRQEVAIAWQRLRQMQEEDVVVIGTIESSNPAGLLVEVEHLRGFMPLSHLAPQFAQILEDNAEGLIGMDIPLKFLEVDEQRARLVLSNRRASGESNMGALKIGDVVLGTVQSVKPYGAFVDLGNGMNGLLHISQVSHDRISNLESILSEGDKLKVMILSQDRERGRMGLSTKKLEPTPGDMLRDPALVFAKADEMAAIFKERVAAAEEAARDPSKMMEVLSVLGGPSPLASFEELQLPPEAFEPDSGATWQEKKVDE